MTDIVGLVASIFQFIDVVAKTHNYIQNFRDAPKDQWRLLSEIQSLKPLITKLEKRMDDDRAAELQDLEKPLVQFAAIIKRLETKLESTGIPKFSSRVTWSLWGKDDVQEGLNTIERFKSSLNAWLGMDTWNSSQGMLTAHETDVAEDQRAEHGYIIRSVKHLVQENRIAHNQMISNLKDVDAEQRVEHAYLAQSLRTVARNQELYHNSVTRDEIIEWYSPLNFFLRQADIFNTRQPGTGRWLLEDDLFKAWKSGTGKVLWCPGMPGAGKTVLASVVVDHLRANMDSQSTGVAVLYLNHKETEVHSPSNLLAGVWRQLVLQKPISSAVHQLYAKHREPRTRPSLEEIHAVLCSTISEHSEVFIIIDALDEYPEQQRNVLLRRLSVLGSAVSLMVTSRLHIKINNVFANRVVETLEIRATEDDIRRYVDGQIAQSLRLSKHIKDCPGLREEIETTLVRGSDGMFLLPKLHIDSLATKHTVKAVRDALNNMPDDLNSTYDRLMERINRQSEDDKKLALLTLAWVTNAKRPLRASELREALAVEHGTMELDEYSLLDIDIILSVCAGLVIIDEADKRIRLVHYTTQKYLDGVQPIVFPRAQTEITMTCITYLSFDIFSQNVHNPKKLFHQHSLLHYAVKYCLVHARGGPESDIQDSILSFLKNSCVWLELWSWKHGYKKGRKPAVQLWLAAAFHLAETCRYLIKEGDGDRVLLKAAAEGHIDMVQLLLDNGANSNPSWHVPPDTTWRSRWSRFHFPPVQLGMKDKSALKAASARGHAEIISVLLDHDADIDLGGRTGTALQIAAFYGHMQTVRLLISRGADVNIKAWRYGTALAAASVRNNYEIALILLGHGAKVNANDGEYGSALQASSFAGHREMVDLLIGHGADVNATGGLHGSALQAASSARHKEIISLLLEHVSLAGDSEIARLLIKHGADVNAAGGLYGSVLQGACLARHEEMVRLLVEHGADVNANGIHGPALYIASRRGSSEVVRHLLEHVAKVEGMGGEVVTVALRGAFSEGHQEIVRLLLEHGENASDALYMALLQGWHDEATVKILIEHGADPNVRKHHGSALYIAACRGSYAIVHLLIKHGAEVKRMGRKPLAVALHTALLGGHNKIVRLLIEHGADASDVYAAVTLQLRKLNEPHWQTRRLKDATLLHCITWLAVAAMSSSAL
ncbi:ankyrin repeat-containing domain protein [Mycena vulgaris]|nr:ankyrin repeat-containing domain protein [Mycena vulgaris]